MIINTMSIISQKGGEVDRSFFSIPAIFCCYSMNIGRYKNNTNRPSSLSAEEFPAYPFPVFFLPFLPYFLSSSQTVLSHFLPAARSFFYAPAVFHMPRSHCQCCLQTTPKDLPDLYQFWQVLADNIQMRSTPVPFSRFWCPIRH